MPVQVKIVPTKPVWGKYMRKQSPKNIVCVLLTLFFVAAFTMALAAGATDGTTQVTAPDLSGLTDGSVIGDLIAQATGDTSTIDPSTIDPSTVDPSTIDPSTVDPSTIDPSTIDPSTIDPSTIDPSTIDPSTIDPSTIDPSTIDPSTIDPTTVDPTVDDGTTVDRWNYC